MFTDYQTKKNRMTNLKPQADFDLADDDDFFGFDHREEAIPMGAGFRVAFAIVGFWFAVLLYQAVKYLWINGINLG